MSKGTITETSPAITEEDILATFEEDVRGVFAGLSSKFASALSSLVKAEDRAEQATENVARIRVKVGAVLFSAIIRLTALEKTSEQIDSYLVSYVQVVSGRVYDAKTMRQWATAHEVESVLPADLKGQFNVDSLRVAGAFPVQVPDGKKGPSREDFLRMALNRGIIGAHSMRALKREVQGTPEVKPDSAENTKKLRNALEKKFRDEAVQVHVAAAADPENAPLLYAVFGATVAWTCKDQRAVKQALETVLYQGPVADEADGSGAEDAQ